MVRTRWPKLVVVEYTLTAFALSVVYSFCRVWLVGVEVIVVRIGTGRDARRSAALVLVIMVRCMCRCR